MSSTFYRYFSTIYLFKLIAVIVRFWTFNRISSSDVLEIKMAEESLRYLLGINSKVLESFERKPVFFSRPYLLGLYDIEYENFSPAKKIRYHFKEPRRSDYPLDLNEGKETFQFLEHRTEINLMRPLLHAITHGMSARGNTIDHVERTDVYTRRGIIAAIMQFSYTTHDVFVRISRYKGKIYLIKHELQPEEFKKEQSCTHHRRLSQLLFVDTAADVSSSAMSPDDDNVFQVCVHLSNLGKFNIYYVARTQGIVAGNGDLSDLNKQHYVATKQMWKSIKNKNLKFLKFWTQAYLSNVSDLYLAYKVDGGIVREPIERLKVSNIPKTCYWKPGICTTFLNEFLTKVEQLMSNVNSLDTVYKFHLNASDKTIHYAIYEGKTDMSFIPKEFADLL